MPKSKVSRQDATSLDGDRARPPHQKPVGPSHPVYITVMFGLMLLGLLWLVVNYLAGDKIPFMQQLNAWNFGIGFAFIVVGLLMTMRWR